MVESLYQLQLYIIDISLDNIIINKGEVYFVIWKVFN